MHRYSVKNYLMIRLFLFSSGMVFMDETDEGQHFQTYVEDWQHPHPNI